MSNYWDPRSYSVDDALKDIAYGHCDNVQLTDDGVIKDYGYKVTMYNAADNEKGHISTDFYYGSDGRISSIDPHDNN